MKRVEVSRGVQGMMRICEGMQEGSVGTNLTHIIVTSIYEEHFSLMCMSFLPICIQSYKSSDCQIFHY